MKIEKIVVRSLIFPSILTIAACSPYVYKEEVGKFQNGVAEASKMLDSQSEYLSNRGLAIIRNDLLDANSPRLVISGGCEEAIICLEAIAYSTARGESCHDQFVDGDASETGEDVYKAIYRSAISKCGVYANGGLAVENATQLPAQRKVIV